MTACPSRDLGLAEIDLGKAGAVGQRDEDLGAGASPGRDDPLDDGLAAGRAILVTKSFEDAPDRMPLLLVDRPVTLEDLVDDGKEGIKLGSRSGMGAVRR